MTPEEKQAADQAERQRMLDEIERLRQAREAAAAQDRPMWGVRHRSYPDIFEFWSEQVARNIYDNRPGMVLLQRTPAGWRRVSELPPDETGAPIA